MSEKPKLALIGRPKNIAVGSIVARGPDVIVCDSILHLSGRVGRKYGAGPAEGFGDDVRQCQSAIETLAVELTEPGIRLFPVPNQHDRLDGIVAPGLSPVQQKQ